MTDSSNDNKQFADKSSLMALKMHGEKIVYAVIAVLIIFFGWQYYQKHYAKVDTVAADMYTDIAARDEQLVQTAINPSLDDAAKKQLADDEAKLFADIDALVATHGDTAYAWQALMIKARHQTDNDDLAGAVTTLNQATTIKLDDEGLLTMTKLRYARAMLANNDVDGALAVANETMPKAFEASRQELLGDIYLAKNDTENAKKAYQTAWDALRERQENRAVLSLKLQSLGVTVEPIETPAIVATPAATAKADEQTAEKTAEQPATEQAATAETQTTQTGN
ncbi:tetratricopeptide repeat protein [uncultured Moraxella sp.]|uniref:YfgM family protein n=1 Tax=uncultured Moraxella sp. TaxID=263769 RepID=UPI0025F696BE|nr:tetratricopeptide repeat protein [uncultured Moraxella sp.]